MKIDIQAPWEVNKFLKNTIHDKVEKLSHFSDQIIHTNVFLKLKEHKSIEDKIVEIRVSLPGPYLFAEGVAETYEKAVIRATEKVKKQLVKRKEKRLQR
ncbi:MAG: ribosome-associated translation inhibitor RaiA [Saprospiraceae bacterium]